MAGMLRTEMFSHRMASQRWAAFDHILERGEWPSRRTNGEQGLGDTGETPIRSDWGEETDSG